MPVVKIKHVVSFSSEEAPHKADNLIGDDTTRKWKCAAGEKSATVVLQFEKSTKISSIDIGNEGSAFIEVLVGRATKDTVQYQVILVASSFMSPQESRTGTSPNRVRIFGPDNLVQSVASQKWDIVKVVCTQPFSKRLQYGMAFIKFHTLGEEDEDQVMAPSKVVKSTDKDGARKAFGNFKVKEEKGDKPGQHPEIQMFLYGAAKKQNLNIGMWEMKNCATMDDAKKLIEKKQAQKDAKRRSHSPEEEIRDKRRKTGEPSSTNAKSTPVKFSNLKKDKKPTTKQTPKQETPTQATSSKPQTPKSKNEDPSRNSKSSPKRTQNRPFDRILHGVVFVISGFQNPLRSELRDRALAMGAQYRRDWTADSTHLICAFPNTPKYRQVVGCGGRIVRKEWINDCASRRQLVPWRKYNMQPGQPDDSSSSEEEMAKDLPKNVLPSASSAVQTSQKKAEREEEDEEDPYGGSTDEDAGDTEDEIERVKAQSKDTPERDNDVKDEEDDIYNASTDEEQENSNDDDLPPLPDYFCDKHFLLYGDFANDVRRLIRRHIIACGGKIVQYMNDDVEYVITEQSWDRKFDQALTANAGLVFVKPAWLFSCGSRQRLVPYQPFVVPPL